MNVLDRRSLRATASRSSAHFLQPDHREDTASRSSGTQRLAASAFHTGGLRGGCVVARLLEFNRDRSISPFHEMSNLLEIQIACQDLLAGGGTLGWGSAQF